MRDPVVRLSNNRAFVVIEDAEEPAQAVYLEPAQLDAVIDSLIHLQWVLEQAEPDANR